VDGEGRDAAGPSLGRSLYVVAWGTAGARSAAGAMMPGQPYVPLMRDAPLMRPPLFIAASLPGAVGCARAPATLAL
jgi:hypothetical protein